MLGPRGASHFLSDRDSGAPLQAPASLAGLGRIDLWPRGLPCFRFLLSQPLGCPKTALEIREASYPGSTSASPCLHHGARPAVLLTTLSLWVGPGSGDCPAHVGMNGIVLVHVWPLGRAERVLSPLLFQGGN